DDRFKYHWGCSRIKLTHLCFADDLLMLCHGDHVSACILRRALDEFSMSSGLYLNMAKSMVFYGNVSNSIKEEIRLPMPFNEGELPVRYLGISLTAKKLSVADCRVLMEKVKKRILDWRNKSLSLAGKLQLVASVLSSLHSKSDSSKGIASVAWKDVCRPKEHGGLGLKSLSVMNHALMIKHLWNIASKKDSLWVKWLNIYRIKGNCIWNLKVKKNFSWNLKQILSLRDSIRRNVGYKIGNGEGCFVWYDRWHSNGPLCRLISNNIITHNGFDLNAKVADLIDINGWKWPNGWNELFSEVVNVQVPNLIHDCNDKGVWNKLKSMCRLDDLTFVWAEIVSGIAIRKANNTLWSIIQRLVFGAAVYFIWQERNFRLFWCVERSADKVFDIIVDTVRLRLLGLKIKRSPEVDKAATIWKLPVKDIGMRWDCRDEYNMEQKMGGMDIVMEEGIRGVIALYRVNELCILTLPWRIHGLSGVPDMFRIVGDGSILNKGVGYVSNFGVGQQSEAVGRDLSKNDGLKQSMSFASAVSKSFGGFGNNKLKYVSTALNDEGREVAVMDPVLEEGTNKWSMTVVGHFIGFQMGYREIVGHLKRMWRLYQLEEVIINQGMYYFNFKSHEGMQCVIENRPWMLENKPLFVRKWEPGLCMSKLDTSKLPLWVKIYDIPLEAWNVEGISRIASRIDVPIIMDKITTSICEKPYGRASYARVLVEVDAAKGLVDSVEIWYKNLASMDKKKSGDVNGKSNMAADTSNSDKDGWQNVDYRRGNRSNQQDSFNRFGGTSGFNGYNGRGNVGYRGRGDYNSQGHNSFVKNGVKENLGKYVPVKNKEKVVSVNECLITDEFMKSGLSSGVDKLSKEDVAGEGGSKVDLSETEETDLLAGVKVKESAGMDDISMSNRFDILNDGIEEEELDVWEDKIWSERSIANKNLSELRMIKLIENLHSRIVQLRDHRLGNARKIALQLVKDTDKAIGAKSNKSLFDKYFNQICREITHKVKELQWDKNMIEYFVVRCEEINNDKKNGHHADDDDCFNMDEVQEDTSGFASFMVQNEVFSGIDDSMAQMQAGLAKHSSSFQ
ncbi:RNA-directed DNA polymerase, eukaryota, reverse transcriptase zinc-binding domain protein, partial [Tanacetum coccineum]